jgi:hypothetical protein
MQSASQREEAVGDEKLLCARGRDLEKTAAAPLLLWVCGWLAHSISGAILILAFASRF